MEDDCEECINDWNKHKKYHIDCWMGPPTLTSGTELIACENALTSDKENIIVDPANNYPVDATSLFNGTTQVLSIISRKWDLLSVTLLYVPCDSFLLEWLFVYSEAD